MIIFAKVAEISGCRMIVATIGFNSVSTLRMTTGHTTVVSRCGPDSRQLHTIDDRADIVDAYVQARVFCAMRSYVWNHFHGEREILVGCSCDRTASDGRLFKDCPSFEFSTVSPPPPRLHPRISFCIYSLQQRQHRLHRNPRQFPGGSRVRCPVLPSPSTRARCKVETLALFLAAIQVSLAHHHPVHSRPRGSPSPHSSFLVLRTVLSVAVAKLDGRIVRDLVSADAHGFLRSLALWFALAVPSIYTNSMVRSRIHSCRDPRSPIRQIRYLQSKLSLRFRDRLTRYIHDLYLSSSPHLRYYRVPLQGIDQYITADVESWSESVAGI
jgi:hypothetical protein